MFRENGAVSFSLVLNNSKIDPLHSVYDASKETLQNIEIRIKSGNQLMAYVRGIMV